VPYGNLSQHVIWKGPLQAVESPDGRLLFKAGKQFICKGDRIALLGRTGQVNRPCSPLSLVRIRRMKESLRSRKVRVSAIYLRKVCRRGRRRFSSS